MRGYRTCKLLVLDLSQHEPSGTLSKAIECLSVTGSGKSLLLVQSAFMILKAIEATSYKLKMDVSKKRVELLHTILRPHIG